jgi:hypothetical protein
VIGDIARLLHPELATMREGAWSDWLEDHHDRLRAVHEETETALQIMLRTSRLQPGRYTRPNPYAPDWTLEAPGQVRHPGVRPIRRNPRVVRRSTRPCRPRVALALASASQGGETHGNVRSSTTAVQREYEAR